MDKTELKPGYLTTEFYVTLFSYVLPLATLLWHRDFSGYVQVGAQAAAGIASLVYIITRASVKNAHAEAQAVVASSPGLSSSLP